MQFKRPFGYPSSSKSRIILDRKKNIPQLAWHPNVLFFKLQPKLPRHINFQHNVLYKLRNRIRKYTDGDVTYVCPLFLDRTVYRHNLHLAAISRPHTLAYRGLWLPNRMTIHASGSEFDFIDNPLFSEHICIPPHERITNAKHSYSFTEQGRDVCFHSPLSLPESEVPLDQWLGRISEGLEDGESLLSRENSGEVLNNVLHGEFREILSQSDHDPLSLQDGYRAWMDWGAFLSGTYNIHQFAIIQWKV